MKPTENETELRKILIEYDMGKTPLFPSPPTAEKAIANKDKAQAARDYALLRIEALITSDKQRLSRELTGELPDIFRRLEERVEYNRHNMGETGMFIRVGYVKNFLESTKKEVKSVIQNKLEGLS